MYIGFFYHATTLQTSLVIRLLQVTPFSSAFHIGVSRPVVTLSNWFVEFRKRKMHPVCTYRSTNIKNQITNFWFSIFSPIFSPLFCETLVRSFELLYIPNRIFHSVFSVFFSVLFIESSSCLETTTEMDEEHQ